MTKTDNTVDCISKQLSTLHATNHRHRTFSFEPYLACPNRFFGFFCHRNR